MRDGADGRHIEKRRRILDAARDLMLRNGLRGTTMEAIARQAEIAKPTLYAQFADKDAVYAGIVDGLMDALLAAFAQGMAGPGDLAARIGAALAGQHAVLNQALAGSPHAGELISEHKRAGAAFRDKDRRTNAEITAALAAAGIADAAALTPIITAAAYGIALKTPDAADMHAAILLLCRRLIEPALPR
ncbi:MAG: TetR/AcrR family transcriptional regulator [Devosia sp.]